MTFSLCKIGMQQPNFTINKLTRNGQLNLGPFRDPSVNRINFNWPSYANCNLNVICLMSCHWNLIQQVSSFAKVRIYVDDVAKWFQFEQDVLENLCFELLLKSHDENSYIYVDSVLNMWKLLNNFYVILALTCTFVIIIRQFSLNYGYTIQSCKRLYS